MKNGYSNKNSHKIGYGKPTYGISSRNNKYKRRKHTRLRNRIIIIAVGIILATLVIWGLLTLVSALLSKKNTGTPQNTITTTTTQSSTPTATQPVTQPLNAQYTDSVIKDNNKDATEEDGIYVWNNNGFEAFAGKESDAKNYAKIISEFKTKLGDEINVYNMVIPTHIEFGMPQRAKSKISTQSQADFLKNVYSSYTSDVKTANCYNILAEKANDYTFFKTDDTWTSLGAYYAYTAFADVSGITPVSLSDCSKKTIEDYKGYYVNQLGISSLWSSPDKIDYYKIPNQISALVTKEVGEKATDATVYNDDATNDTVFLGGSYPLYVIKSDCNTNKKILLVKEYYGNAFAPYLAANYDEVHIIDYRKWTGDIKNYCQENKIDNILFLNSAYFASKSDYVNTLKGIIE